MAAFLLGEALLQLLHDLIPAAERLDLRLLFLGEQPFGKRAQPLLRNFGLDPFGQALKTPEDMAENPVELIEMALVFHERGAGKIIKVVDLFVRDPGIHRFKEGEILLDADRNSRLLQLVEETQKHLDEASIPHGLEKTERPALEIRLLVQGRKVLSLGLFLIIHC